MSTPKNTGFFTTVSAPLLTKLDKPNKNNDVFTTNANYNISNYDFMSKKIDSISAKDEWKNVTDVKVTSLIPVLIESSGVKSVVFVDMKDRKVYFSHGIECPAHIRDEVLVSLMVKFSGEY